MPSRAAARSKRLPETHPAQMDLLREIYFVKPVDNSRLVPAMDPHQPRRLASAFGWIALAFLLAMYLAWQRQEGVEAALQLEQLQQHQQALVEANRKLRLEEAFLGDPVRIDRIARTELGMAPLAAYQIVPGGPLAPEAPVLAEARPPISAAKSVAAAVPQ